MYIIIYIINEVTYIDISKYNVSPQRIRIVDKHIVFLGFEY